MKNAKMELITDDRYFSFMGAVNKFFNWCDVEDYNYTVQYGHDSGLFSAFVTYWK